MKEKEYKLQSPPKLVFIAGFPRSGTTWMGNLLNSHPHVIYRHEPLGWLHKKIGLELMGALKFNNGLTESERQRLLTFLVSAHPISDRPPFFHKSHEQIPLSVRFFLWGVASKLKISIPLYKAIVSPHIQSESVLVIKETGWNAHLPSIIQGLDPQLTVFMIRHPCATVASFLNGFRLNLMSKPGKDTKINWVRVHSEQGYLSGTGIDEHTILDITDAEFITWRWRIFTEICLNYQKTGQKRTRMIIYEDLQSNPQAIVRSLFSDIGLSFPEQTEDFLKKSTNTTFTKLSLLERDSKATYYSVYRSDNHDVNKWKRILSETDIERIKQIVGEDILNKFWN
jgi:hypothetical protein